MTFKQRTYQQFQQLLEGKISNLQHQLNELKDSTANETKSTVGDKYETTRAMLQIEQDNIRRQLQEALELQSRFGAIDKTIASIEVVPGSLVKTNKGWLLLGVALGKRVIDGIAVMAVSPQSPLGKQLVGLKPGDNVTVNEVNYYIEEIL